MTRVATGLGPNSDGPPPITQSVGRRSPRRVFAWSFIALFLVFGSWSLANPLTAAPDEPAHAIKAAAVVRGQFVGTPDDPAQPGKRRFTVPAVIAFTNAMPGCFAHDPTVPASCTPTLPQTPGAMTVTTSTASTDNPLYYAIVGLPSLAPTGPMTLYLMRLVSAGLCALVLAWAFAQASTLSRADWVGTGMLAAITPMVAYLGGTISPTGLEVAAGAAVWILLSAIIRDDEPGARRSRVIAVAVVSSVFVNLGRLSPLLLAVVVLASVMSSPLRQTRQIIAERSTWPWIGLVTLATAAALTWNRTIGSLDADGVIRYPALNFWEAARSAVGDTSPRVANMIGQFGWMDTDLPTWTLMFVAGTIGAVLILGLALGNRRERIVIVCVGFVALAAPVVLSALQARYVGMAWQGRYFLPIVVGLPVLAANATARSFGDRSRAVARRALLVVGSVWVFYQTYAFAINLHRYQSGVAASWFHVAPNEWTPPLPAGLLLVIQIAGLFGTVLGCLRSARRDDATPIPFAPDRSAQSLDLQA